MTGYHLADWSGLFTAEVGASASLAGLLFVALSINLDRIVGYARLPARAAETLALLVMVLLACSGGLLPQSATGYGIELLAIAAPFALLVGFVQARQGPDSPDDPWWWFWSRVVSVQAGAILFAVCGVTLVTGGGGGLWWALPAVAASFSGAVYNAWVLLVEIVRSRPDKAAPRTAGAAGRG